MPKIVRLKDVVEFVVQIKEASDMFGSTEEFQQGFAEAQQRLSAGLKIDTPLNPPHLNTPLGPQAAAAFQAFQEWYAGWAR